jgi:dTMP kinase
MQRFITFEGIEGSGKSTQAARAAEFLAGHAVELVSTREPGGTGIGDAVRRILLDPANAGMAPMTELLLVGAARVQHVEEVILPALAEGKVVLCDRFEDSTRAYQGFGRQIPENLVTLLCSLTAADLKPGLTFLLDLPPEEGLRRAHGRNSEQAPGAARREDRIDREEIEFHRRVRDGYLLLAREHPGRFRVVNAQESPDKIARRIARDLALFLKLA